MSHIHMNKSANNRLLQRESRMKKEQKQKSLFSHTNKQMILFIIVTAMVLPAAAYCDVEWKEIEGMNSSLQAIIFSSAFRKTALLLGGGMGLWGCWSKGSIAPLLKWGGIGLLANFLPKIIDVIASVS